MAIKIPVGAWGVFDSGIHGNDYTHLERVNYVDAKGRMYTTGGRDNWRLGFDPETGRAKHYSRRLLRPATEAEIAAHLAEVAAREQKNEERAQREAQPDWQTASRLLTLGVDEVIAILGADLLADIEVKLNRKREAA